MQVILRTVRKLCGCVSIIEKLKPSGASEEDILNRAKDLMMQNKDFSRGFKFDHVWPIMKDLEKFSANDSAPIPLSKQHITNLDSSQLDNQEPESPMLGSQGINSFPINHEGHRDLINVLQKGASDMQQNYDIKLLMLQNEQKKLEICQQQIALVAFQEENKILYMDLTTSGDPEMRQMVQNERARIMQKREEERRQHEGNKFGKFFGDFGGSGSGSGSGPDFPDY
ncbi:uncharacterized protein [Primulina huaijiensis]|uniref:uncharacterized protein n=1 Tax=Primulina huaijiensis TaxID=1492673 RepID=UPI003CC6DF38